MGKFFEALMEQPDLEEGIVDGVIEDDTQEPTKESAFAPVTEAEVESMKTLLVEMAAAEDITGAVNRDAIADTKAKKITRIPVRKISGKEFFRVCSDKNYYRQNIRVIESRANAGLALYLVSPKVELPPAIRKELKLASLYTGMSATKDVFLLYIPRNTTTWYESAIEMMRLSLNNWIKVEANMNNGGYDYYPAYVKIADPAWSDLPPFEELLTLAFKGRVIDSLNHPVISRMLGVEDDGAPVDDGRL